MAEEKNVSKEKVSFGTKFVNFFKNLPANIARPFKNMWYELRKVTWPTRQDLIKYSIIVVTSAPLLIAYPFLQKYFVKGVMIGAVKG